MADLIDRQSVIDALDVLCQEHRYKIPGKVETYSQYNEAWQDALDRAEGAIGNLPSADIDLSGFSDKLWATAYERGKAEAVRCEDCVNFSKTRLLIPQSAEVVRCKDCKHSYETFAGLICSHGVCVDCVVRDDFYCSNGERKDA